MSQTDPIADMLTSIRNASRAGHPSTDVPYSNLKKRVVDILQREGFVRNVKVIPGTPRQVLRVYLGHDDKGVPQLQGLRRISTPGLREYVDKQNIPTVLGGYGMAVLSTSRGVMTNREAQEAGLGGEVLCHVW